MKKLKEKRHAWAIKKTHKDAGGTQRSFLMGVYCFTCEIHDCLAGQKIALFRTRKVARGFASDKMRYYPNNKYEVVKVLVIIEEI